MPSVLSNYKKEQARRRIKTIVESQYRNMDRKSNRQIIYQPVASTMVQRKHMLLIFSTSVYLIILISNTNLIHCSDYQMQVTHSNQQPKLKTPVTHVPPPNQQYQRLQLNSRASPYVWSRGLVPDQPDEPPMRDRVDQPIIVRRSGNKIFSNESTIKMVRHIQLPSTTPRPAPAGDVCNDRLCYGLPQNCFGDSVGAGPGCSVLVTSRRFIDPNRPSARDILFEMIAMPVPEMSNYAAIGFSETGQMQGLVSECLQYRDSKTHLQIIKLKHSYNIPLAYTNVPATIHSGIKNLGVSYENGYYQCRWIVESAVDFSYEATNGSMVLRREEIGYKDYYILLASGQYNEFTDVKSIHIDRVSSLTPVNLAQIGQIRSLGSHIFIRVHGSLMIAVWVGLVTLSIVLARYYKNEWYNSRINDLAIWFVVHRTLMITSWIGSVVSVIFAYLYAETIRMGLHQVSGFACIFLITVQFVSGLFRPSQESSKRIYFNWTHFVCGNLSYLFAIICLVTAAFLVPAQLPSLYIWVIVAFVAVYAITHALMTIHQYIIHTSSKLSITPMNDLSPNSMTVYSTEEFIDDPKEVNSPFRQFMLGIFVTIIVIFIVLLISLVNLF